MKGKKLEKRGKKRHTWINYIHNNCLEIKEGEWGGGLGDKCLWINKRSVKGFKIYKMTYESKLQYIISDEFQTACQDIFIYTHTRTYTLQTTHYILRD